MLTYNIFSLQGFFEVGSGLGYAIGPPIGGLLYTVRTLCAYLPQPLLSRSYLGLSHLGWWVFAPICECRWHCACNDPSSVSAI